MATAVIINKSNLTRKVESKDYSRFKIVPSKRIVRINETLPFRVRFTNIMVLVCRLLAIATTLLKINYHKRQYN